MDEIQQIKERNKQLQLQQQQQIVIQPQQQQQRQLAILPPNQSAQSNVPIQSSIIVQPVNRNPPQQQAPQQVQSQFVNPPPQRPNLEASYLQNPNMANSIVQSNFQGGYQMPGYNYQQQIPGGQMSGQFYSNYNQPPPQQYPYQQIGNYYPPPQPQGYNPQYQLPQQMPRTSQQVVLALNQVNTSPKCRYCKSQAQQYVTLEIGERVWCWVCILLLTFWPLFYLPFFLDTCKDPITRCGNCHKRLF